jgi:sugar/nucleoside kinase (ribokinase family)
MPTMSTWPEVDITCFSYLAGVHTLHVPTYPLADYGVGVDRVERFLAGDGPIVAGAAVALGFRAALVSNSLADDDMGRFVASVLERWGVITQPAGANPLVRGQTPFSTVVSTRNGSRAWFAYLPGVVAELAEVDLTQLSRSRVAYVDCYELFGDLSFRPVAFALDYDVPVIANLGGSPPPDWLINSRIDKRLLLLQSSVPDDISTSALSTAAELAELAAAEHVVVTRGRYGAVAITNGITAEVPARSVPVKTFQGAGSVFSAALAARLMTGEAFLQAVGFACNAASEWCERGEFPNNAGRQGGTGTVGIDR